METTANQRIEIVPGKCGGKPVVAGTRIRVWDVYVLHERQGKSADEVIADFPALTLADVYAALAYYYDHKPKIDAQMKAEDDFVDELRKTLGPGPLARKLESMSASDAAVSP